MIRIVKNIPAFCLILAALVIYAHMIIPHDHHSADIDVSQEKKCPVSDNGKSHHRGLPVHCHAFNDLASEKAITFISAKNIKCSDLVSDCQVDLTFTGIRSNLTLFYDFTDFSTYSGIPVLSCLRAPPILS
jgi:hypothetical protein